jgi:phosphatidylserine/phosphatidylglycerophosphate/cardiolipin synthase-like enzyme
MPDFFVTTGTPARERNFVMPLVNGEESWRWIYNQINAARESIHLCFWALQSEHALIRTTADQYAPVSDRRRYTLAHLLNERQRAGVRIRILLWDYPLGARSLISDNYIRLAGAAGTFEVLYQSHPSTIGSWHQKFLVVDDSVAFVGGMNAKTNDWDTDDHEPIEVRRAAFDADPDRRRALVAARDHTALDPPRHDYMTVMTGPIVADVQAAFVERWNHAISRRASYSERAIRLPAPTPRPPTSDVKAQITRTMPEYPPTPRGERGIKDTYIKAIRLAERYIYIENQYFRSAVIARELAAAMTRNPSLRVIVVIPPDYLSSLEPGDAWRIASPSTFWTSAAFDTLRAARADFTLFYLQSTYVDRGGRRVFVPIDLHAKLMIVDDAWYTIGSCNINDRGFDTEGELNVSVQHASARDLRKRIWGKHLGAACPDAIADATRLWFERAAANNRAWNAGSAPTGMIFPFNHAGPLLPTVPRSWI